MGNQENEQLSKLLGMQDSVKLADGNMYMLNELNLQDLRDLGELAGEDKPSADTLVELLFKMIQKGNPKMTKDNMMKLVTASMLNTENPGNIIDTINRLSGGFVKDTKNEKGPMAKQR